MLDEPAGQPVQQLRMGRRFTHRAEVARCPHQTDTEMILPDAVDDHASGQRVVQCLVNHRARVSRRREVLGAFRRRGKLRLRCHGHRRNTGADFGARVGRLATV